MVDYPNAVYIELDDFERHISYTVFSEGKLEKPRFLRTNGFLSVSSSDVFGLFEEISEQEQCYLMEYILDKLQRLAKTHGLLIVMGTTPASMNSLLKAKADFVVDV